MSALCFLFLQYCLDETELHPQVWHQHPSTSGEDPFKHLFLRSEDSTQCEMRKYSVLIFICLCFNQGPRWKQVNSSVWFPVHTPKCKGHCCHCSYFEFQWLTCFLSFHSAIVSATLKCLMKFYNITDNVRIANMSQLSVIGAIRGCHSFHWSLLAKTLRAIVSSPVLS